MKSPAENTLTPETFRLVATHAAVIGGVAPARCSRQHARLLVGGLDQAVADAAMLGAFAEREDVRRAGLQRIVDHDAAVDGDAGVLAPASTFGRMPAAKITASASMRRPSASSTPSTGLSP